MGQTTLLQRLPSVGWGMGLIILAVIGFLGLSTWANRQVEAGEALPGAEQGASELYSPDLAALAERIQRVPQDLSRALKRWFTPLHAPVFLVAGIGCGVLAFRLDRDPAMHPWPTLFAWMAGIGLFVAGAWALSEQAEVEDAVIPFPPWTPWEVILVIGLTLVALLVRGLAIGNIPNGISADEAEMGMVARAVRSGSMTDAFATSWLSHPNLWFFLQALSITVFGDTLGGLRMVSVVVGTAALPLMYQFARMVAASLYWNLRHTERYAFFTRLFALLATILLGSSHFHLHYSRYALNNIADPALALTFFILLCSGFRTHRPWNFASAGVVLGLALHFYMGARLLLVLLATMLCYQLVRDPSRVFRMRRLLLLLGFGFFLGIGPLLQHFLTHPQEFSARFAGVGIFSDWFKHYAGQKSWVEIILWQFRAAFGAYTFVPDTSCQYDPGIALLDPISAVFFVFGVALAIVHGRKGEMFLLLAWVGGAAFFGGVLLANTPESGRYVITTPALSLLVTLAVMQLGTIVYALVRQIGPFAPWSALISNSVRGGVVALVAAINLYFYFAIFVPRDNFGWAERSNQIGHYLARQPENSYVYFLGAPQLFLNHGPIRYFASNVPGVDVTKPIASISDLPPLPAGRQAVFVILPWRMEELSVIQQHYPNGETFVLPDVRHRGRGDAGILFMGYRPLQGHQTSSPPSPAPEDTP